MDGALSQRRVFLGVRVWDEEDLDYVASRVLAHGWKPTQDTPEVNQMISFRRGSTKGKRRNYHLLYLQSNLICRTLDTAEFEMRFDSSLVETIETAKDTLLCFMGQVVESSGRIYLSTSKEELPQVKTLRSYGRLTLTKLGQLLNLPRGQLHGIHIPEATMAPLGSATHFAYLRANCFSELSHASPLLRELCRRLPMVTLEQLLIPKPQLSPS